MDSNFRGTEQCSNFKVYGYKRMICTCSLLCFICIGFVFISFLGNVSIPFCLRCTFERVLQRVILWMSSGGIQTVLHQDVFDSFYCLLDGTKDFYLVDSVRCRKLNFNQYFFNLKTFCI